MKLLYKRGRLAALALLFLLPLVLRAQSPQVISYQGVLTDGSGQVRPDGAYQIALRLYDGVTGGSEVWRDDNQTIQVVNGVFSATIGGPGKQPLPRFDRPYWLSITVDGQELAPRTQLTTVPYSFHAERADTALHVAEGIPAGTVMAFAGSPAKIPAGWRLCDGSPLASTQFPVLFDAIGTAWGDGSDDSDATTNFNLPDLRGMFLRGIDTSAGVDPDAGSRYALKSGGATGAQAGSYQNDATTALSTNDPFNFDQSSSFNQQIGPDPQSNGSQTFTATQGSENRPKNAGVNYIIKVR